MIKISIRNTGCTLVRVLDHIVISAMSISTEVILTLILVVLKCHMIILLTLVISHNAAFLRVDINILIPII